jgi:hypothetical protein
MCHGIPDATRWGKGAGRVIPLWLMRRFAMIAAKSGNSGFDPKPDIGGRSRRAWIASFAASIFGTSNLRQRIWGYRISVSSPTSLRLIRDR